MSVGANSLAGMNTRGKKKQPAYLDKNAVKAVFRPHGITDNTLDLTLSASQRAVFDLGFGDFARVLGAPQSGKTTALKALFLKLAKEAKPESLLVFTANRTAAATLRDELALAYQGASNGPMARTIPSLAFAILRHHALMTKSKLPELISGSEQDAMLEDILDAVAIGELSTPDFPKTITKNSLKLRGVRTEVRDLISIAIEHDLSPAELRARGEKLGRQEWVWGAAVYEHYLHELDREDNIHRFDPTSLVVEASKIIRAGNAPASLGDVHAILVDDAQELTPAATDFLRALSELGASVVLFGDPDVATLGFRSGDPEAMTRLASELAAKSDKAPKLIALEPRSKSHHQDIAAALSRVTDRLGSALGGPQRIRVDASEVEGSIVSRAFALQGDEHSWLAHQLRSEHLNNGVQWRDIAVVARSAEELVELENALAAESVPVRLIGAKAALKDQFASAAFLTVLEAALGQVEIDYAKAVELLETPLGNFDSVELRRLRRALRGHELNEGGVRTSHELLVAAFSSAEWLAEHKAGIAKKAARFIKMFFELRDEAAKPNTTIQDLIWLAYSSSVIKTNWPQDALGVDEVALQTGRNLDAVVALFAAAARYVERNPRGSAIDFVKQQLSLKLPEDSIGVGANLQHRVSLVTPAGLIGRKFRVIAVAHLQEGIWPNLRPRSSLLGATSLDELIRTNADSSENRVAQNEMPGELRMLAKAVGAATERLYLSAISTEEEQASQFFELLTQQIPEPQDFQDSPLTLRAIAGNLRRKLIKEQDSLRRLQIAGQLARLAEAGVAGAHPDSWWGLAAPSTSEPLAILGVAAADANALHVRPAQLEDFVRCPLHWFINAHGGSDYNFKARVGDLMHEILERAVDIDKREFEKVVESKWSTLEFESKWTEASERRRVGLMVNRLFNYLAKFDAGAEGVIGRELPFKFAVGGAHVTGRVDRVELLPDGTVRISDLKTSKYLVAEADVQTHPQLGVYQLALLNRAFEEPKLKGDIHVAGAQLIEIGEPKASSDNPEDEEPKLKQQVSFEVDETAKLQMEALLGQIINEMLMTNQTLVAKVGEHCKAEFSFGSCDIHLVEQVTYGN